ncbi:hypothetical protein EAF04_001075 [Stromatinia cepivora]|nr:hypothetical protein EAF04_001075 [Stromatinia cepivora]
MTRRRETKKAPPDEQTIHDERLALMSFDQQAAFLTKIHGHDLRMSSTKPKPKARFQLQPNKARLARLPTEIISRIGNELGRCGCQNKVPLALTCHRFYLLFCNDIVWVHMEDLICLCPINTGPMKEVGPCNNAANHGVGCRYRPLWRLLEDWSGLHGYRYCLGRHSNCCSRRSKLLRRWPITFDFATTGGIFNLRVPWLHQTRLRVEHQEAVDRRLCRSLSSGLFIRCAPQKTPRHRTVKFLYSVPSTKRIECELDRQARHCWAKEMMLAYSEWRDMSGL